MVVGMGEPTWTDHKSRPMTVGELRASLASLPAEMLVMAVCPENVPESAHTILNAVSCEVRSTLYEPGQERLLITASAPTGRYPG